MKPAAMKMMIATPDSWFVILSSLDVSCFLAICLGRTPWTPISPLDVCRDAGDSQDWKEGDQEVTEGQISESETRDWRPSPSSLTLAASLQQPACMQAP